MSQNLATLFGEPFKSMPMDSGVLIVYGERHRVLGEKWATTGLGDQGSVGRQMQSLLSQNCPQPDPISNAANVRRRPGVTVCFAIAPKAGRYAVGCTEMHFQLAGRSLCSGSRPIATGRCG